MTAVFRLLRGCAVLSLSLWFLSGVFAVTGDPFWNAGIGDWMDPYFINYLLEHWDHSVRTLSDPLSPPMYFPAAGTLGYSHGLVLFAPFYLVVRPFFHPFQAYSWALFLVCETGVVCLYVFLRRSFALSFVESLLLTLFFMTSLNVTNGFIGIWSQRASVFLIPPILLLFVIAKRRPPGRLRTAGLFSAGLLSLLMFTQDFYTALFGLCFVAAAAMAPAITTPGRVDALRTLWARSATSGRAALVMAASLLSWALFVALSGGFSSRIFGVKIASHDWTRPAALAIVLLLFSAWAARRSEWTLPKIRPHSWTVPFGAGAIAGLAAFLWIYGGAYREHPSFPVQDLMNSLVAVDVSIAGLMRAILETRAGYETLRTFKFIILIALLASVPVFKVDRRTKVFCLWALIVSVIVLLIPLRFNGFSIWQAFFAPLPGFSAIRDPKRVAYLFELAVVVAAGAMMSTLPARSSLRAAVALVLLALLLTERNGTVFEYLRPNATFRQWVSAPLSIDPACRSFYVAPSGAGYTRRSNDRWTLYSIDAMFIALDTSVPTLNGYSAWFPRRWSLQNPEDTGYRDEVRRWVTMNHLTGVCELDLTTRTMTPAFRN